MFEFEPQSEPLPEHLMQPVEVRAVDMPPGHIMDWHHHVWGQLAYASQGVLTVSTATGTWAVPPERAVWIPPRIEHRVSARKGAAFRSLYVEARLARELPPDCGVVAVSPLMRELIVAVSRLPRDYDPGGPGGRLAAVILDELRQLETIPLYLPMPRDPQLLEIAQALSDEPGDDRTLAQWAGAVGSTERTLARRFVAETGLSFGAWRQRLRLLASLDRLMAGEPVTSIALDLGYDSPSAFTAMFRRTLGAPPTQYLARSP